MIDIRRREEQLHLCKKIIYMTLGIYMMMISICLAGQNDNLSKETSEKINLVWQPVIDEENDLSKIDKIPGVNVVSPSWFVIDSEQGHIQNKIDINYLKNAREKGYKIWPLIHNDFNAEMTHKWLNDKKAKDYIIRQLIFYAHRYNIEGYNFDLENIYDEDRDKLTEFMKEVTEALHQDEVIISMDITVASDMENWSKCYDRKTLGEYVDYLVLMAYDEHGRLSKTAGSVASLNWVENGVKDLTEQVPSEKIILGIPLYMRLWEEDYEGNVSAKTLNMEDANKLMKEKDKYPIWLKNEGQIYFAYHEDGKIYRVWKEDVNSLRLKVDLVKKYKLAGVASWRKGFETKDIWPMINKRLQK